MAPHDVREEGKIDLHNPPACRLLPPVTNSINGQLTEYAKAIIWCERWIDDQANVTPDTVPSRLAWRAASAWHSWKSRQPGS